MSNSLLITVLSLSLLPIADPAPSGMERARARAPADAASAPRSDGQTPAAAMAAQSVAPRPEVNGQAPKNEGQEGAWNPVTFANVLTGLPTAYYDPKRLPPKEAFLSALGRLERAAPEVVVFPPDVKGIVRMIAARRERWIHTDDITEWMSMGDRLLDILRWVDLALGDPTRRDELQYAAIKGSLKVLDPHTVFFTPEEYARQQARFSGSTVGVGLMLTAIEGRIVVREVVPKGPADRAGVRVGDILVQVGALDLASLSPEKAAELLRGEVDTQLKVILERRGQRLTFTLTRAELAVPSVHAELLPGRVALLRVTGFPKNTLEVFAGALAPLVRKKPAAWILDLRGNEGGYIMQAARMADYFLAQGLVCKALGKGGQNVVSWEVKPRPDRIDGPLVVLVDRGTASAAEILAGTLSVNDRAILLGERTWGKGTVQKLFPMPDKSVLKLTMWQYLLAGDIPIQSAAIIPDVVLTRVRIGRGRMRFLTASQARGESTQKQSLDAMAGAKAWKGRPVAPPIRYLVPGQTAQGGSQGAPQPAAAQPADPVLELAREIAAAARSANRGGLIRDAAPLVEAFRTRHEAQILDQLKTLGVDWRPPPTDAPEPVLSATLSASPDKPVAGQTVSLALTLENNGQTDAFRVGATFSSFYEHFDGRELLFGHLAPGQKRTLELESELAPGMNERWELVRAHVHAGKSEATTEAQAVLHIQELLRPRFQLSWLLDDRKGGNGDGQLSPGESATLRIWVHNIGPGSARSVHVDALQAMGGVTMSRARASLPELAPGATEQASLPISLSAQDRPGIPKSRASITLSLFDEDLGGNLEVQIVFPKVLRGNDFLPSSAVVSPRGDDIYLSAHASPEGARVGLVRARTRLRVEATRGTWLRVALPDKRFAFVKNEDTTPATSGPNDDGYAPVWQVAAPEVSLAEIPAVSVDPDLQVSGHTASPSGVKDLWVRVWNPETETEQVSQVDYQAAPPGGAKRLEYRTKVPLRPGNNHVVVDARDLKGVTGQVRRTVYRPSADDTSTPRPPPRSPPGEETEDAPARQPETKRGCRCDAGQGGLMTLGVLILVVLGLMARRRSLLKKIVP